MKRNWSLEELIEHWTILPKEQKLLSKKSGTNKLGLALLLKFYKYQGRFPALKREIPLPVVSFVAQQLNIDSRKFDKYNFDGRTIKIHRAMIRNFLRIREATLLDQEDLKKWLANQVLAYEFKLESLLEAAETHLRSRSIEPPTPRRLEKLVRSVIYQQEKNFFQEIYQKINEETQNRLDQLLATVPDLNEEEKEQDQDNAFDLNYSLLSTLRNDPGRIGLDSWKKEAQKLEQLRQLNLPSDLFKGISSKILETYKQRVTVEPPRELRRHPDPRRYTLLAAFCWLRTSEIIDNLVELLIQIVHRIGAKAERKVEKELLEDFKKVSGKTGLLFQLAEAALDNPSGTVKDVIYPLVGETTLKNLVREFKSTGTAYREKVYTIMRSSYSNYYRRMIPILLEFLEFRSNNGT